MITRFVARDKNTGLFLSRKPAVGKRVWVKHINDAELYKLRHHASVSADWTKVVEQWSSDSRGQAWDKRPPFPIEIIEFNVLLIDASKGYIG